MTLEIFLALVITFYYLLSFGFMVVELNLEEKEATDGVGWVLFFVLYNMVMCMFQFPLFLGLRIAKNLKTK